MSCSIDWNLVFNFLTLIVTLLTLWTTVYFTKQLVANDNQRARVFEEERAESKRLELLQLFESRLINSISNDLAGQYQVVANNLAEEYPNHIGLIITAIQSILKISSANFYTTMIKVIGNIDMYDQENKHKWSEHFKKYQDRFK